MDRRRFLLTSLAGALAAPLVAEGQQAGKVYRIGWLSPFKTPTPEQTARSPFRALLRERGWDTNQNLVIERAYAEGREDRLPDLAAELVRKRVDVIVTHGPDATLAAARATKTIPIVFFLVGFPVEHGLVDSLARPGRNVTGVASFAGIDQAPKQLEFLRQIAPKATRLAWIWTPSSAITVAGDQRTPVAAFVDAGAQRLGFELRRYAVHGVDDFESVFSAILSARAQALGLIGNEMTWRERQRIVDFANRHGLPSAFPTRSYAEAGGLLAYGPLERETLLQSVPYVDRILRGAQPADLPVELPTKFDFVINLKTAKALGLTIPPSLLARADQVIE
jgi:putative tryptophan/tyrosine transport system substrate-binding protein